MDRFNSFVFGTHVPSCISLLQTAFVPCASVLFSYSRHQFNRIPAENEMVARPIIVTCYPLLEEIVLLCMCESLIIIIIIIHPDPIPLVDTYGMCQ